MKKVVSFCLATLAFVACRSAMESVVSPVGRPTGRSVLIYSHRQYQDTYQVTAYDAAGIPQRAITSVTPVEGVWPLGTYTSTVQLAYDSLLRLTKTVQIYDQLGYASCCSGSVVFDPNQRDIHEYTYQGTTKNITHELTYRLNPQTGKRQPMSEFFRQFTDGGQLAQEKRGDELLYEATYDPQGQLLRETIYPAETYTKEALTRHWTNEYDGNQRLLSRQIDGSTSRETNTYDAQGRLIRQVSNLYETTSWAPTNQRIITLAPTDHLADVLIDYSFRQINHRWAMRFAYFNGQFLPGDWRVLTYAYQDEQTLITQTTYQLGHELAQARQPGFDFGQIPQEDLLTIAEKNVVLSARGKMLHEAFQYTYVSPRLQQFDATASEYEYTYDEAGNLTSRQGSTTSPPDKTIRSTPTLEVRYKRF